jgi:hypothetical protein
MKLIYTLIIGLIFITSCSKENGTYEEPQEPLRRLELLEVPPITAEKEIKVDQMVDGSAGTFRLTDHQVYIKGFGKVTYTDAFGKSVEENAWGSALVPYTFNHKSNIVHGFDFVNVQEKKSFFTNNDLVVLSSYHEVPVYFDRTEGLFKNVVHFEVQLNGAKDQLTVQPSFIREKSGSFMVKQIYNDPTVISVDYRYYKVNDSTFQKRSTMIRDQQGVVVETVHISTYELVNEDHIPFDLLAQSFAEQEVGPFFVNNKKFKLDYDFYNQAVVYFSTHIDGVELFKTFKEAMLFANSADGLAEEGEEAFLFAEKVISKENHAKFLSDYMMMFNEGLNVFGMTMEEAKAYVNKELSL